MISGLVLKVSDGPEFVVTGDERPLPRLRPGLSGGGPIPNLRHPSWPLHGPVPSPEPDADFHPTSWVRSACAFRMLGAGRVGGGLRRW